MGSRRVGTGHILHSAAPGRPRLEGGAAPVPRWPRHRMGRRSRPGQHLQNLRVPGHAPTSASAAEEIYKQKLI